MNESTRGKLIVMEGIDGSGKSTVAARVVSLLQEDGCTVVLTREPGGTHQGARIRELIKEGGFRAVPDAEFMLFAADRAVHLAEVVIPALKRGDIVVCDRMGDSSYAYQGWGNGVDLTLIDQVNAWLMRGIRPQLTVYFAVDYAVAQQRIEARGGEQDSYDQERATFFKKVIRGYESLYAQRSDVLRIEGKITVESAAQLIYQHICGMVCSDEGTCTAPSVSGSAFQRK